MGDTIDDMNIEIEQKHNKTEIFENTIGLPDSKVIEEMNKLGLNKISFRTKVDRILDTLNVSLS